MQAWFNKQNRLIQVLLLLIPVVNWVVEVLVRLDSWQKNKGTLRLVVALL